MRPRLVVADQLERQSVMPMESTIPVGITVQAWRRQRAAARSRRRRLLGGDRPERRAA